MKYIIFVILIFLLCSCDKKDKNVNINDKHTEINNKNEITINNEILNENIEITNDVLFDYKNDISLNKSDTDEISYVTTIDGNRIFLFDNLNKNIYKIPELYDNICIISETKRSGNMEPTGILPDNETILIEVVNEDFEIYYWKKNNEIQIRRIIIKNNTEISPLGKYIGLSVDDVISDFGSPVFQDGAFNGDYGTLYYGISDGIRDYGTCEVFFSHRNYYINNISYGFSRLIIKGWD
jgi:hypothetical protein